MNVFSPKVSVLMSVYNNVATVEVAVQSILNQTYKEFELIIVDDASTDNSPAIIKTLAQKDKRISIIQNKTNLGLAASLNLALAASTGELIARQDGHGRSAPERFTKQLDFLSEHPNVDIVGSATVSYTPPALVDAEIKHYLKRKNILVHGSIMMKAKTLKDAGGYNPNYRYVQDYELWKRLAKSGAVFANLAEPLYEFNNQKARSAKANAQRLLYLLNAKQGNKTIIPLSKLPIMRKIEFCRYTARYFIKRFLHI